MSLHKDDVPYSFSTLSVLELFITPIAITKIQICWKIRQKHDPVGICAYIYMNILFFFEVGIFIM